MEIKLDNSELKTFIERILEGKVGMVTKEVKKQVASGVIYVPKSWIGKIVIILIKNEK